MGVGGGGGGGGGENGVRTFKCWSILSMGMADWVNLTSPQIFPPRFLGKGSGPVRPLANNVGLA